jgi:hypothetical protein
VEGLHLASCRVTRWHCASHQEPRKLTVLSMKAIVADCRLSCHALKRSTSTVSSECDNVARVQHKAHIPWGAHWTLDTRDADATEAEPTLCGRSRLFPLKLANTAFRDGCGLCRGVCALTELPFTEVMSPECDWDVVPACHRLFKAVWAEAETVRAWVAPSVPLLAAATALAASGSGSASAGTDCKHNPT